MFEARQEKNGTFSLKGVIFENVNNKEPCTVLISQDCIRIKDSSGQFSTYRTQDFFVRERLSEKQYRVCSNERTFVLSMEANERSQMQLLGTLVNNFRNGKLPWKVREHDYNPVY